MNLLKSSKSKFILRSYDTHHNSWNLDAAALSVEDCKVRLNEFVGEREVQRKYIEAFFDNTFQLQLQDLFDIDKFDEITNALDVWAKNFLLPVYDKKFKFTEFFLSRPFVVNQKLLVFISDLGFYFGDVIKHHSSYYEWSIIEGLNQEEYHEFQRPVLVGGRDDFFDIERLTFKQFVNFEHEFKVCKQAFGEKRAFDEMYKYDTFTGHITRLLEL